MKKARLLLFIISLPTLLLVNGCKKDEKKDPTPVIPNPPGFTITTTPEVSMKIDGSSISYKVDVNNVDMSVTQSGINDVILGSQFGKYVGNDFENIIWFGKGIISWSPNSPLDSAKFVNFFATGTHPYTPDSYNSGFTTTSHGIEVFYTDANDVDWSTAFGTADQTGSNFSINQNLFYRYLGDKYIKVKCTFNCKLYDGNGAMKTITDGTVIMDFYTEYED